MIHSLMVPKSGRTGTMMAFATGFVLAALVATLLCVFFCPQVLRADAPYQNPPEQGNDTIRAETPVSLPAPQVGGTISVEEALMNRRSVRNYADIPLSSQDISQLLWAGQGITGPGGLRTAPSAGARYPLEIYLASGNVSGLPPGLYRYLPESHALVEVSDHDVRYELYNNALLQVAVRDAPAVIIIAADYNRTTGTYGNRGIRYADMEAGHAAGNICLQAYTRGIGTVPVGAFDDRGILSVLGQPPGITPLYLMPVGNVEREP